MYNADDGWVMGHIQRDIDNMQKFLKGENEYNETLMGFVPKDIQMANEYGLTKYAEYMKQLYNEVQSKMNNWKKSFYLIFVANYNFDIIYIKIAHFKRTECAITLFLQIY